MNMILLGALVKAIDLPQIDWEEIIKRNIKPAFVDINLKAFQVGRLKFRIRFSDFLMPWRLWRPDVQNSSNALF